MFCTSEADIFKMQDFPRVLFSRKYRGRKFVAYNLKYDSGALLQKLPEGELRELWEDEKVEYEGFIYSVIGNKCLSIRNNNYTIHIYDMYK